MPAATNKTDLLAAFDKELAKLRKTLDGVDEAHSCLSTPEDETTIKGVIAHRTHWMGMFHGWYEDSVAGREVHVPARGYKWNQLKEYNASLYARGNEATWVGLLSEFESACDKLHRFIEAQDDVTLYSSGVHAWTGKWSLGRFAEASGPSHFRSANSYIRRALRSASTG
ncbi:ClbS/DfsB family four-helix bundle protein [Roseibium sp. RKSG952]|uniref:ClbS/DfsB family four-helix bundle protein n=1 Tax=Roseibium sp. RKSG952 TaxID=2529384 RepID=UPI0012BCF90A|nr:ClbS/DfsB family four-helix bundle protein [Roseibium sp. RKSG952]MTI02970.1 ClbS/DfsB family four-helix bundle protein [Roseibium sp. RKSG952]